MTEIPQCVIARRAHLLSRKYRRTKYPFHFQNVVLFRNVFSFSKYERFRECCFFLFPKNTSVFKVLNLLQLSRIYDLSYRLYNYDIHCKSPLLCTCLEALQDYQTGHTNYAAVCTYVVCESLGCIFISHVQPLKKLLSLLLLCH